MLKNHILQNSHLTLCLSPSENLFWLESDDPVALAEACAEKEVYLVPLDGGVRIGLCALALSDVEKVVDALSYALS